MANANLNANDGVRVPEDEDEDECVCGTFGNNELHQAIVKHILVGDFHGITCYDCYTCKNNLPTWRNDFEDIKASLMTRGEMERMIEKRPNMLLEQNNNDQTPFQIIPELIEMLEYSGNWEYVKYYEQGLARFLAGKLREIKEMIEQNGGGEDDDE
jgi:hypothetical protein